MAWNSRLAVREPAKLPAAASKNEATSLQPARLRSLSREERITRTMVKGTAIS